MQFRKASSAAKLLIGYGLDAVPSGDDDCAFRFTPMTTNKTENNTTRKCLISIYLNLLII